jgi:hypothetical protein
VEERDKQREGGQAWWSAVGTSPWPMEAGGRCARAAQRTIGAKIGDGGG